MRDELDGYLLVESFFNGFSFYFFFFERRIIEAHEYFFESNFFVLENGKIMEKEI